MDNFIGRNAFKSKDSFIVRPYRTVFQKWLSNPIFQALSSFVEKWAEMGDRGE